jgi:hypothetical protein
MVYHHVKYLPSRLHDRKQLVKNFFFSVPNSDNFAYLFDLIEKVTRWRGNYLKALVS